LTRGTIAAAVILASLPTLVAAQGPSYRIEAGDIRVTVPLKPGGAFEAKTASLSGTLKLGSGRPLLLEGEVLVDLTTIDTGIDLRNRHLRENYLETGKGPGFDRAVLASLRLADADGERFLGRTAFSGELRLHGTTRAVSGTAEVRKEREGLRVEASFPITLTDFGIEPPLYMGVGVANRIMVKVLFRATPTGGSR
jgi:polyisoprenoid-binding protein YceI